MKRPDTFKMFTLAIVLAVFASAVVGDEKPTLTRGEDHIETPAIGDGLCVHNLFQSNMVIQRDKPIVVRGWASSGEGVTVSFGGQEATGKANPDRSWQVTLPEMKANATPQAMIIKGTKKTLTLENILIGDVWLLTGQSNMAHSLTKIENGSLEAASANYPHIRLFTAPMVSGAEAKKSFPSWYRWDSWGRRHEREGFWDVTEADSGAVRNFSGLGYAFVRRVHMAIGIPIGAIDLSRGGTTIEAWTPLEVLKTIDTPEMKEKLAEWDKKVAEYDPQADLEKRKEDYAKKKKDGKLPDNAKEPTKPNPGPIADPNYPGNLYAGTMTPFTGFPVTGVLWHQGYNNAFEGTRGARMYYQLFPQMIAAWRKAFNDPKMPFCIISLCTAGTYQDLTNYTRLMVDGGINIREVQYKTFADLYKPGKNGGDRNIGFVSSYDQRDSWYHPYRKIPVAERAACWALATQYRLKPQAWEPTYINEMTVEEGRIVLSLNGWTGAATGSSEMTGFSVAGKDRVFHPANCEFYYSEKDKHNRPKYDRRKLVLTSPHVPNPIHYRYAWGRNPLANVAGFPSRIPLPTQRSDSWSDEDLYEHYFGKAPKQLDRLDRGESHQLRQFLIKQDLNRRLKEAEMLLEAQKK